MSFAGYTLELPTKHVKETITAYFGTASASGVWDSGSIIVEKFDALIGTLYSDVMTKARIIFTNDGVNNHGEVAISTKGGQPKWFAIPVVARYIITRIENGPNPANDIKWLMQGVRGVAPFRVPEYEWRYEGWTGSSGFQTIDKLYPEGRPVLVMAKNTQSNQIEVAINVRANRGGLARRYATLTLDQNELQEVYVEKSYAEVDILARHTGSYAGYYIVDVYMPPFPR